MNNQFSDNLKKIRKENNRNNAIVKVKNLNFIYNFFTKKNRFSYNLFFSLSFQL